MTRRRDALRLTHTRLLPRTRHVVLAVVGLLAALALLSGCGSDDVDGTEVAISDPAGRLADATAADIRAIELPDRTALIVVVRNWNSNEPLGPQADSAAREARALCDNRSLCSRRGIFVFLSETTFPMVRVGSEFTLRALWGSATYGNDYVELQRSAVGTPVDTHALRVTSDAVDHVIEAVSQGNWFERASNWSAAGGYGDFATGYAATSFPSDGLYEAIFVKPLLRLQVLEGNVTGTWWLSIGAAALVLAGLRAAIGRLASRRSSWSGSPCPSPAH